METEPIAVALKFGFLAVLYLFLLWVARSAFRELRRTTAPAPEATGFHPVGPGGRAAATDASLVVTRGGGLEPGERFDLFGGLSIGRSTDADVRIEDRFASGVHARLYSRGASYYVEDMNSTNGTFLNGGRLDGEAELSDLDELRIGDTEFRFELEVPGAELMLRVVEQAHRTDTGRQRNANEDAYFARGPLFAVADGMGGAQAGEVASRLAAESFEPVQRGEESPEAYLRAIARTANARIHRLAQADSSRSGMGTTLTAALVEDDEVSFAHVGDSRAYLFRDGELKLLTSDHSLVEELRRQGRLTDEQAEDHPQRSIITRALGPEREVEVDTMTYRARPGDVYLLCSDGLTTMVREERIAATLADTESLDDAVSSLVREANEAGGRDNITVVAFRLEEAEAGGRDEGAADADRPGRRGGGADGGGRGGGRGASGEARERAASPRRPPAGGRGASPSPWPRSRCSAALVGGAVYGLHQVYFLGTDSGGRAALYRGLPYDLPLGIELYSEVYAAPVQVSAIPASRRDSATDHTLRSHDDAADLLEDLQSAAEPPVRKPKAAEREAEGGRRPGRGSGARPQGGGSGGGGGQ